MNYRSLLRSSVATSLVVGTFLILVNRYEEIFSLNFGLNDVAKWSLNYLVPFCVSFYSRYMALRSQVRNTVVV